MFKFTLRPALTGLILASLPLVAGAETVTNGDATIEYSVRGEGPLIVFLASTGRGTAEFGAMADRLAERGFRVALPEPRGIGGSTGPMEDVSFHDFGDDFAKVIEAEGAPAIVAGHAYGNWIARTMAHDHPDLVRGVVLVAAGAEKWPAELSDAITMINEPPRPRNSGWTACALPSLPKGTTRPRGWKAGTRTSPSASAPPEN